MLFTPHPDGPRRWRRNPDPLGGDPERRAMVIARGPIVRIPVRVDGLTPAELAEAGVNRRRNRGHAESVRPENGTSEADRVPSGGADV